MKQQLKRRSSNHRPDVRTITIVVFLLVVSGIGFLIRQLNMPEGSQRSTVASTDVISDRVDLFNGTGRSNEALTGIESSTEAAKVDLIDPIQSPRGHMVEAIQRELKARFDQATVMLHAKRYNEAIVALNRTLELEPRFPEAYTNLGFAYLGLGEFSLAEQSFEEALEINPAQANAYYGLAMVYESKGDLEGALGGMRSFLHTTQKKRSQIHVARARSAIWEWESQLGRGAWGETRGIPPGFTADELKRDGRGVGIKMPLHDTIDAKGNYKYEIKAQDKFQLFEP